VWRPTWGRECEPSRRLPDLVPLARQADKLADAGKDFIGFSVKGGQVSVVVDDEVGHARHLREGGLDRDARAGGLGRRSVALDGARDPDLFGCDDGDERSKGVGEAVLHEQGCLVASERLASRRKLLRALNGQRRDARVRDGVQSMSQGCIDEHDSRKRLAVERPVRQEHPLPENVTDLRERVAARHHNLAREGIRIEHRYPSRREPRRHRALARGDPPRQTEQSHPARYTEGERSRPCYSVPVPTPIRTSRRKLLQGSLAFGALVVTGSGLALLRTRGYSVPPDRAAALRVLSAWQWVFVTHAARRIAAPDRPHDPSIPTPDEVDVAGFIDGYVAAMPPALRRDLLRGFAYVEHVAPLGLGHLSRFTRLPPEEQDEVLASLETSDLELLRGTFEAIKSLVFMGYYRDARTWKILGYEGPLIHRPARGWTR
jgi:hypothetical protein